MKVNIGKTIDMDINVESLPANALQHVVYIGLRNILMDAHASVTKESNPADMVDVARAMAEKKLAAMMAGEVRVTSTRTAGDPVRTEAIAIAITRVRGAAQKKGMKLDPKKIRELAVALAEKDPAIRAQAEKTIADRKAAASADDIDLDALMVGPDSTEAAE